MEDAGYSVDPTTGMPRSCGSGTQHDFDWIEPRRRVVDYSDTTRFCTVCFTPMSDKRTGRLECTASRCRVGIANLERYLGMGVVRYVEFDRRVSQAIAQQAAAFDQRAQLAELTVAANRCTGWEDYICRQGYRRLQVVKRDGRGFGTRIDVAHWNSIVRNATNRGIDFRLTPRDLCELYDAQRGLCALTGAKLVLNADRQHRRTASLDRIDSYGVYDRLNVQWVTGTVNCAKLDATQSSFIEMCRAVAAKHPFYQT